MTTTTAEPANKGILRDETIMLRWIFGHCRDAKLLDGTSWPAVPQTSVPRRLNSDIKDLGFLSIDVDHFRVENGVIQRVEIGLSFLKAQSLQHLHGKCTQGGDLASGVIKSLHLVFGHKNAFHWKNYHFLFGKARPIKPSDLEPVFIIDTVKAAQFPLQLWYRYSLKQLLEEFEIPYSQLHVAENDAHLTLRVLLMIAVRDAEIQLPGKRLPDWVPIFKAVAQSSLPPRLPTRREIAAIAEAEAERQTDGDRSERNIGLDDSEAITGS
ncbi:QDE-2-interacting protein [Fusarium subglutinans]|uniref:QDE-2-interacting protein n=1 Tax=Gibberella subglutinans TaxID=42677 RepID=A0A8H5PSH6_GIBSU|nr:QDE-2-interacting protein [Fusarium subglutinans]KAF5602202.1 QDE-2-interacting protein [Fusarium subglutinans]